jgi:hypothetical protein
MSEETQTDAPRSKDWYDDRGMALWYMWGRMDMGETRDVNDNFDFAGQWADAKQAYRDGKRGSLPPLQEALKKFDAKEAI